MRQTGTSFRELSGRWTVLAMFTFGILATGLLWFYWNRHIEPFMPLQTALAERFPDSSPRVEGGKRKLHQGTPRRLRIVMRVAFDPEADDQQVYEFAARVVVVADEHVDLSEYDVVEMHLYMPDPEQQLRQRTIEGSPGELRVGRPPVEASLEKPTPKRA